MRYDDLVDPPEYAFTQEQDIRWGLVNIWGTFLYPETTERVRKSWLNGNRTFPEWITQQWHTPRRSKNPPFSEVSEEDGQVVPITWEELYGRELDMAAGLRASLMSGPATVYRLAKLSNREEQVMRCIAKGYGPTETGSSLGISRQHVKDAQKRATIKIKAAFCFTPTVNK